MKKNLKKREKISDTLLYPDLYALSVKQVPVLSLGFTPAGDTAALQHPTGGPSKWKITFTAAEKTRHVQVKTHLPVTTHSAVRCPHECEQPVHAGLVPAVASSIQGSLVNLQ